MLYTIANEPIASCAIARDGSDALSYAQCMDMHAQFSKFLITQLG